MRVIEPLGSTNSSSECLQHSADEVVQSLGKLRTRLGALLSGHANKNYKNFGQLIMDFSQSYCFIRLFPMEESQEVVKLIRNAKGLQMFYISLACCHAFEYKREFYRVVLIGLEDILRSSLTDIDTAIDTLKGVCEPALNVASTLKEVQS
jgi:hypothetical protein